MKVGILTYPNTASLGASLQMYSLYKVLADLDCDVEIINYAPPNLHNRLNQPTVSLPARIKQRLKNAVIAMVIPRAKPLFRVFENQMIKMPETPTSSTADLRELSSRYDRIIVGSDQVWNEKITGHDSNFYLEFCEDDSKKASYAASFGNEDVEEAERNRIAELLSRFSYISVREKQGQSIVRDLIGRTPALVLDPTLLITPSELRKQIVPYRENGYVLFYTIKPSPKLRQTAQIFADMHGLKLVFMNTKVKDRFDRTKHPAFGIGPREFLGLVDGAEYIFTNSFHGVAISVALRKPFYVEFSSDTNSRLRNIVELLDVKQCIVDDSVLDKCPVEIDYDRVDEKLTQLRESSLAYLRGVLR